jgi:pyruvate, water dikinase
VDTLYWLHQIHPSHRQRVGNKAFYLGYVGQRGYPVMPGFVIPAAVSRQFLEQINWTDPLFTDLPHSSLRMDIENPQQLQAIAQRIRQTIHHAPLADSVQQDLAAAISQLNTASVILRPSLVLPVEQQRQGRCPHESMLFSSRISAAHPTPVLENLKRLWADLFGAKSLFYWQRLGLPLHRIGLAVIVQPIQSAIAAGIIHPQTNPVDIQATMGLGMAIARGEVCPDSYAIDPNTGAIQTRRLGLKSLSYELQPAATPMLQVRWLGAEQQAHYALVEEDLAQLLPLIQRLRTEFSTATEVEWVISPDPDGRHQCFLTQLILSGPRTNARAILPSQSSLPSKSEILSPDLVPAPPKTSPEKNSQEKPKENEDPPQGSLGGHLLASGIAAAPGRVIAKATVIQTVIQTTLIQGTPGASAALAPGTILIAPTIPLDCLDWIHRAAAIVTEQGTLTGHTAIVAREIGIPAVVAAAGATQHIRSGDLILVDGNQGTVYRIADAAIAPPNHPLPNHPITGTRHTQLLVNLSQPDQANHMAHLPIDGVGLLRSELLMTTLVRRHPSHSLLDLDPADLTQQLTHAIQKFTRAFAPRPVFYRALDLRSHEFKSLLPDTRPETNPILGIRGTFSYQLNPTLFDIELAALATAQKAGATYLNLLLPFVRTVEEFQFCRDRVAAAGLMHSPHFRLWIMAEVPSVLFLLPEYVKAGLQGISIGSNDLTQLLLGIDRDHEAMAPAFPQNHPAVIAAIAQLIQHAQQLGIPCSICGEVPAQYPEIIPDLIRWGITALSVSPDALARTHAAILQAETQRAEA